MNGIRLLQISAGIIGITTTITMAAELHPIVEVETGYFFGATRNGEWLDARKAVKSMEQERTYSAYSLTERVGQTRGRKPVSVDEPCPDTLTVALASKPARGVIALDAPWNALPRKARVADTTQKVYVDLVGEFLKGRGIKQPKVKLKRILRVDLDGDGEEEALISATNYFDKNDEAPMRTPSPGSYSIVLLRRVVGGKVQTQLVAGELYLREESSAANVYDISAVLDLDGDGKLEVVVHSFYYEGASTTIYRCTPGKVKALLSVECGV